MLHDIKLYFIDKYFPSFLFIFNTLFFIFISSIEYWRLIVEVSTIIIILSVYLHVYHKFTWKQEFYAPRVLSLLLHHSSESSIQGAGPLRSRHT